jgi:hypothetical protein
MRALRGWAIIGGVAVLGFLAKPDFGNTIAVNGNLSGWGVNLQTADTSAYSGGQATYNVNGVTGSYNQFVPGSFVPANPTGISYVVEQTLPAEDEGGGFCDVKAIYATFDTVNAYFAVVTTCNPNGTSWDGYGNMRFGPGDLNITVSKPSAASVNYGIGARPIDLSVYGDINDIWGPQDQRAPTTWAGSPYVANTQYSSFTTSTAMVAQNPTWSHVDNPDLPSSFEAYFAAGTGTAEAGVQAEWNIISTPGSQGSNGNYYAGYDQPDTSYGHMEPYPSWVYEVAVPLTELGLQAGDTMNVTFAADCGNDSLSLNTLLLSSTGGPLVGSPVPEPMAAIFFGTGLVGVLGYIARRRMLCNA